MTVLTIKKILVVYNLLSNMKQRLLKQQLQDDPSKHVDARNVNGVIPHGMMIPADEHPMLSPNLPFS